MKKALTSVFLMTLTTTFSPAIKAQSLVPNGSFEDTVHCPYTLDQLNYAVGWSNYCSSCDYFNSCAPLASHVSVPANLFGYHYARTGNAYIGLGAYFTPPFTNERECMGIQLTQPLDTGKKYFASFYVSMAASPAYKINIACNKMGMRLSTIAYVRGTNPIPINNYAQIYTDSIITDTLNWVKISGTFIADSAYSYLSIGNFFTDSLTSIIKYDTTSNTAYYYIDDVVLYADSAIIEGITTINADNGIKIFPNPSDDFILIEGTGITKLSLYDDVGKLCISKDNTSSPIMLNVSDFNKGIYFLYLQTLKENVVHKLIIK